VVLAPVLVFILLLAVASFVGLQMMRARRAVPAPLPSWTRAAGDEFAQLSDAERCDLVFAVAALDDEASQRLLVRALDDPSDAVALAAARALAQREDGATLERYFTQCTHERARALRFLVEILN
jgi:hypothetical protein